jgi:hypothetical protein
LAFDASSSFQWYLLACFSLGLLLSANRLWQMAFPRWRSSQRVEAIVLLAAFSMAFILVVEVLANGNVPADMSRRYVVPIAIGLGATFLLLHLGVSLLLSFRRQLALQPVAWLAVLLTLAATGWSCHRYNAVGLRIEMEKLDSTFRSGELVEVRDCTAVTDRGREVQLCRWTQDGGSKATPVHPTSANDLANCHGWVFTDGQYLLWSKGVERILEDNGYELSQSPLPGDLIVYRNASGGISHTGLVQAVYLGGLVVIDSKWGLGGRFIHGPEQQPYGNRYGFYRSARQGHTVAIRPARPVMSIASR